MLFSVFYGLDSSLIQSMGTLLFFRVLLVAILRDLVGDKKMDSEVKNGTCVVSLVGRGDIGSYTLIICSFCGVGGNFSKLIVVVFDGCGKGCANNNLQ